MEKNRKTNILSVLLIAVLVITAGSLAGGVIKNLSSKEAESTTSTEHATVFTVNPTTTANSAEESSTAYAGVLTTIPLPSATTPSIPSTAEEICAAYNKAVNELKEYKKILDIHKTEIVNVEITEFSLPAPTETINSIVQNIIPDTVEDYSFENGVQSDDATQTLSGRLPPFGKNANVTAADVSEAVANENADGYIISITLLPDASDYDGNATTTAAHLATVGNPLDFSTLSMGPISVTNAKMNYHDVTVTAQFDKLGRLAILKSSIPVTVKCTGGMGMFTADIGMNIQVDTTYYVTYK